MRASPRLAGESICGAILGDYYLPQPLIEGRDYGDGVERFLGVREYEWAWTIPAASVPALLQVLGTTDDVIAALGRRFSGEHAADLSSFLEEHDIATEKWSRHGD